jgi:hypothetical protein
LPGAVVADEGVEDVGAASRQADGGGDGSLSLIAVRSTRSALPMLPLVGFSGPPPEPGVPVTEHRALHKSLRGKEVSSRGGGPRRGDRCAAVSVARDAHPAGIEQLPGRRGRPPSAATVASAEFLPGHSAVLSLDPLRYLIPRDLAQVLKGRARHPWPEVGTPAARRRVEPVQQSWQWPVDICSAQRLDLGRDRLEGFLGRIGVDVMPCGASFAVSLDTPPQESRPTSMWMIIVLASARRRPIGARTAATVSRASTA